MGRSGWGRLLFLVALPLFFAGMAAVWLWLYAVAPGGDRERLLVYIPPGSSFSEVEERLVDSGVLRRDGRFTLLALLSGLRQKLKAGEYEVPAQASPFEILQLLASGKTHLRRVTVPEGANLYQVAALLARQQLVAEEEFIDFATDPQTPLRYGLDRPLHPASPPHPAPLTLEGWLFPDTYLFTRGQSYEEITGVLIRRARQVLQELLNEEGHDSGLNELEIMTLASIVEKETGLAAERGRIAGVFFNRLARGMRLQTDPTVIYGRKAFGLSITREDLQTPTPYNTYLISGLPPGPIANPGREAIAAVLRPEESDYLYFVSRNDGSHRFSTTLREHNRAVKKYQR